MDNLSRTTSKDHAPSTNGKPHAHPTGCRPKSVNVIALGPTSGDWHAAMCAYDPIIPKADETWTLNKGFRSQVADVVFIMDDLIGERRKSERYYNDILQLKVPVITSIIDLDIQDQYRGLDLHRYPIAEVIDFYGLRFCMNRDRVSNVGSYPGPIVVPAGIDSQGLKLEPGQVVEVEPGEKVYSAVRDYKHAEVRQAGKQVASYLRNSIPLILAYAGFIGVRTINLFGADYDFPGQAIHEADKPNAEYWCGLLIGLLGIEIKVSSRTTLLSTNQGRAIYGYGPRQPVL